MASRYMLCTNDDGIPMVEGENFIVFDTEGNKLIHLSFADATNFGLIETPESTCAQETNGQQTISLSGGNTAQACWRDDNAVKALIAQWKLHQDKFKSSLIRNDKVWDSIAACLRKENPLWEFSGKQCENKFKDIRKVYTKTKDNNKNQSGQEIKTCKFYDELEEALGSTPIMSPVAIAASGRKRNVDDEEPCASGSSSPVSAPSKKKSRMCRDLEKWAEAQRDASELKMKESNRRHEEKMKRQDRAIEVFESAMSKLLEKL